MLATHVKPDDELRDAVSGKLLVVCCLGCKEVLFELDKARESVAALQESGREIVDEKLVDYLCRPAFTKRRLALWAEDLAAADAVLVYSCGVGVQVVADLAGKPVCTGCDTLHEFGYTGLRPTDADCRRCGDCVIGLTGGICPVAHCAKSLVNGPCGGPQDGKCEIDKNKECVWMVIFQRLRKEGRLEALRKIKPFRNYKIAQKLEATPFAPEPAETGD
jgi:electron transport complex protein RnfC